MKGGKEDRLTFLLEAAEHTLILRFLKNVSLSAIINRVSEFLVWYSRPITFSTFWVHFLCLSSQNSVTAVEYLLLSPHGHFLASLHLLILLPVPGMSTLQTQTK